MSKKKILTSRDGETSHNTAALRGETSFRQKIVKCCENIQERQFNIENKHSCKKRPLHVMCNFVEAIVPPQ